MNRLAKEKSPYLLQHAHNPVDWYPWGDEAFQKAKKEDKPIFLSIGYSTCHWCHVMERESFENEETAKNMNEKFVCIKVDREERPDVDHIYMTAVQAMTGQGGWPLSVFLTPDLHPFFGGTYFPPDRRYGRPGFPDVLNEISRLWREERTRVMDWGQNFVKAFKEERDMSGAALSEETLRRAYESFHGIFDAQEGGFGGAPKFPRSETISLLLRIHRRTGDAHALTMATRTLEKMAHGGIYDHLGGGFHRYSTDAQWLVPHFEKMLYDNALLAKAYLEAYQVDKNPMWAGVACETLDYVLRDMTSPEGGFYSAEDADSEGVEGKFYVWTEAELQKILTPEEFNKVKAFFQTSSQGNFSAEGGSASGGENILNMNETTLWEERYSAPLKSAMQKLLKVRSQRVPPYKDDKIIASWNGLMISAMATGAQVLGNTSYCQAASKAADFLLKNLWDGKNLKRRYREGEARFQASVDDYAFLIQGLLDLYETDFDSRWYEKALALQKRSDELFWDEKAGGYYSTDTSDPTLLTRAKEVYDGAVPSGNSIAALNLLRLYAYTLDDHYQMKAQKLFKAFSGFVSQQAHASPALLMALDFATDSSKEIVLAGSLTDPQVIEILKKIHQKFLPNKVIAVSDPQKSVNIIPLVKDKKNLKNLPTLYVCEGHTCQKPVHLVEEVEVVLSRKREYKLY
ncbi:MAG: thioredoxin domain-containing protein [Deltaproteobacteria bacterium]|nr:thioredoxin domain-containing protein [Deltaproteobacteria bacterium]